MNWGRIFIRNLPQLGSQSGVIIIGAFIITIFFLTVSLAVAEEGTNHYVSTRRTLVATNALDAAEAGADNFLYSINQSSTYQGTNNAPTNATNSCSGYTSSPVTLANNYTEGKVTYETCVQNGSLSNEKYVYATGKIYLPASRSTPNVTRKIKIVINQSVLPNYTIVTGAGGLVLNNNVAIAAGPIAVKGKLSLGNNASIGTSSVPVDVYAQDVACPTPADSTYPQQCSSGNTITTSNNSGIWGNVHVQNNVDTPSRVHGTLDHVPGTISLPSVNRTSLLQNITANGGAPSCSGGTLHLHANNFYSGSISSANNCTVYIDGDVWIKGNLTLGNNSTLVANTGLATTPNIIIDGSGGFSTGNNAGISLNSLNIGVNMYTFWSADSSCNPSCSSVSGSALATSQATTTINLSNNFSGAANSKFFAVWSQLAVGNNSTLGQLMAQRIVLSNNGTIGFSLAGGGGGTGPWNVTYYEQVFQ
jgi:hypothetical protein